MSGLKHRHILAKNSAVSLAGPLLYSFPRSMFAFYCHNGKTLKKKNRFFFSILSWLKTKFCKNIHVSEIDIDGFLKKRNYEKINYSDNVHVPTWPTAILRVTHSHRGDNQVQMMVHYNFSKHRSTFISLKNIALLHQRHYWLLEAVKYYSVAKYW